MKSKIQTLAFYKIQQTKIKTSKTNSDNEKLIATVNSL